MRGSFRKTQQGPFKVIGSHARYNSDNISEMAQKETWLDYRL